jgi:imidazolonepropionase
VKRDPLDVIPTFLFRLTPGAGGESPAARAEWIFKEFLPKLRRRRLARFADVAWAADPDHLQFFTRYLDVAQSLGFPRKVHADQAHATEAITAAVEHFATTIDHLEESAASDARLLAGSCTMATLLPCASFQSGGAVAPARALIDSGTPVALASNFNPQHTPMPNMQTVVALACLRMGMTAAEAISAATINGAHALARADQTGSLEPGKLADVLILNAPDYREMASHFGMNMVFMTIKRGEFIYKEGEVARPEDRISPLSVRPS